jgi:hypothetical protein
MRIGWVLSELSVFLKKKKGKIYIYKYIKIQKKVCEMIRRRWIREWQWLGGSGTVG